MLKNEQVFPDDRKEHIFRPTDWGIFVDPLQDGVLMSKQIFDQERPRSTMAQRLDEAFAGCDQWTVVAAPPRRSTLDASPRASSSSRILGRAAAVRTQEPGAL
jgi:hypothetical protein